MIIENPDTFKSWLTSILEPLCDADPAALAKYVYALVKKDKPVEELREVMVDQLDVFLQQETKPFVEMLFKSLESQEYLRAIQELEKAPSPRPEQAHIEKENDIENHDANVPDEACSLPVTNGPPTAARARSPGALGPAPPLPPAAPAAPCAPPAPRHRLVLTRAPPKQLNRAPPHEQTLVKVLPLTELLEEPVDQPPRRRDRRVDSGRDKEDRRRRRSRSWERKLRARRHVRGDDEPRRHDNSRRLISRSPSPRGRYRNRSPPLTGDRQISRSRSRSPTSLRPRELRVPREVERERMSRDREHRDRLSRERDRDRSRDRSRSPSPAEARLPPGEGYKRRCRDFDEKGYCMRGDLCQWDHGADPVVLEDAALSRVLTIPPPVPEYNPLTPDIWCGAGGFAPYPHPHPHHPLPPRELIPIPRVRHEAVGVPPPPPQRHPPPPKKNFDYNRLGKYQGPVRPPLPANAVNCSLEVKKVPRGLNDITHLNNHFCKFGKIVNIQVCYEGDPEAALITFSNPTEANVAYKSTEAVLNNRFIKVFWHNPDNKQENTAPVGQQNKPQDRSNSQHPMSHNKVLINRDNIKATADNKVFADKEKELANGQEAKKEVIKPLEKGKQVMEMYKRAQALLQTQLQQQVLLIQKLEAGNVSDVQKTALLEAINAAQEGIEKLRQELVSYSGTIKHIQASKRPKTREESQKEILDAELDMFTKQQEGQDVTDLAKKIADLRRQMALQYPGHMSARRPHSRGGRFNTASRFTRGALPAKVYSVNQTVDHRPRALLISGFEPEELDPLIAHFSQFGEVSSKELDPAVPQLVLQYRLRAHAELAALNGRHYNDRTLSITWVANTKAISNNNGSSNGNGGERSATATPVNGYNNNKSNKDEVGSASDSVPGETLLRFDEEEDEEEEARSWRR